MRTSKFLFILILSIFASSASAGKLYWRANASSTNYSSADNWTTNPTGTSTNPAENGRTPLSTDTVYFNSVVNNPAFATIVVGAGSVCHSIICEEVAGGSAYRLTIGPLTVNGNILINGNLTFGDIGVLMQGSGTARLNLGANTHPMGIVQTQRGLFINRSVTVESNIVIPGGLFYCNGGNFTGNGFNITAGSVRFIGATTQRTVDLSGSTITTTNTTSGGSSQVLNSGFYGGNTTYITSTCDWIVNNETTMFGTNLTFQSITFGNATANAINSGADTPTGRFSLTAKKMIINTPNVNFSAINNSGAITTLTVDTLVYQRAANVTLAGGISSSTPIPFTVNIQDVQFSLALDSCIYRSSFRSNLPAAFNASGVNPIVSNGVGYFNFSFSGAGVTAPKSDDLGGNYGMITFNPEIGKTFTWYGGAGGWNDPNKWDVDGFGPNGCIPTAVDNVVINTATITGTQAINLATASACLNITWSGPSKGGVMSGQGLSIFGSADFSGTNSINTLLNFCAPTNETIYSGVDPVYGSTIRFVHQGTYTLTSDFKAINTVASPVSRPSIIHNSGAIDASQIDSLIIGMFESITTPVGATDRSLNFAGTIIDAQANTTSVMFNVDSANLANINLDGSKIFVRNTSTDNTYMTRFRATGRVYDFSNTDIIFLPNGRTSSDSLVFNRDNCSVKRLMFDGANGVFPSRVLSVDTLVLSPLKTYRWSNANTRLIVNDSLVSRTNDCSHITIAGTSSSFNNLINATGQKMSIPGASISNIRYYRNDNVLDSLLIPGGNRGTGNVRVAEATRTPRSFYWIGNGGDWFDPNHWSVGTAAQQATAIYEDFGTNPSPAYNPDGCLPANIDTVYFNGNSFDQNGAIVTMTAPVSIASMFWDFPAGYTYNPTFSTNSVSASGSIVLDSLMTIVRNPPSGFVNYTLTGNAIGTDQQKFDTEGKNLNFVVLSSTGTGRYDLYGDIRVEEFNFRTGSLYIHSNSLHSNSANGNRFWIQQASGKTLDISNTVITSGSTFNLSVVDAAAFNGSGTRISTATSIANSSSGNPISMQSYFGNNLTTSGNGYVVFEDKITMIGNATPSINGGGRLITDTLFIPSSTIARIALSIAGGKVVEINDTIQFSGTPCTILEIRGASDASRAQLRIGRCDLVTYFINYQYVDVTFPNVPVECTNPVYTNYGNDLGSTSGITFEVPYSTNTTIHPSIDAGCFPYRWIISGDPSQITGIRWYRGTSSQGALMPTPPAGQFYLDIPDAGDYFVEIHYGVSGCISPNIMRFVSTNVFTWIATGTANDWNDMDNWDKDGIPDACTDVVIPGNLPHYPIISTGDNAECSEIEFHFGGEVKNTHLLTYNSAKIEKGLEINQWYMLSAPLKNTYSGDFYVNHPNPHKDWNDWDNPIAPADSGIFVRMMHYNIDNYQTGDVARQEIDWWSGPFNNNDILIRCGQGFALFANPKGKISPADNDSVYFKFPKYDAYHNYWNLSGGVTGRGADLDRTQSGRFIYEDADSTITSTGGIIPLLPLAVPTTPDNYVLVGNPFMAHLDFSEFFNDNADLLAGSGYKLAYGRPLDDGFRFGDLVSYQEVNGSYYTNGDDVSGEDGTLIPPMQSFLVQTNTASPVLRADIENHTTTNPGNTLRSAKQARLPVLGVTAIRGNQISKVIVVLWEGADKNYFPAEDSRKLFDKASDVPVSIYLLSNDGVALDINTTNDVNGTIPVGIRTSQLGKITLNFSGMEDFGNTKIQLHDTKENRIIDLNKETEYSFFKMEQETYLENRFFISLNDGVAIDNFRTPEFFVSNPEKNTIQISSPKEMETVEILDVDGRVLQRKTEIASSSTDFAVSKSGIYLVKITGNQYSEIKKVVVK
jgi:hypothetical protein